MSPVVSHKDKAILFTSLVESTLYYGLGAWPDSTPDTTQRLQSTLVCMARLMLRPTFSIEEAKRISALYALSVARILPAEPALCLERLRHFRVVVSKANDEMWALLQYEGSWLRLIQAALTWLQDILRRAAHPEQGLDDWQHAVDIATTQPQRWKRLLKTARKTALLKAQWEAETQQFYGLTFRTLRARGATCSGSVEEPLRREVCGLCGKAFRTLRDWSHHAFKVHGRIREERRLVEGTQCPVCLKHFANTEKLCNHVGYSARCKRALLAAHNIVAPGPGRGSRRFDDGSRNQLPAVQAEGPKRIWQNQPQITEAHRPSEVVLLALESCFCHDQHRYGSVEELQEQYRSIFSMECLQSTRLAATASEWQRSLAEELAADEAFSEQWAAWHTVLAKRLQTVQWDAWLVPDASRGRSSCRLSATRRCNFRGWSWGRSPCPLLPVRVPTVGALPKQLWDLAIFMPSRNVGLSPTSLTPLPGRSSMSGTP